MREVIIFEANDGRRFATKEECLHHEESHFMKMAKQIKDFCYNRDGCDGCVFHLEGGCCEINDPEDWF